MNTPPANTPPAHPRRAVAAYALMIAGGVGLFFVIRAVGETFPVPGGGPAAPHPAVAPKTADPLPHVLLALAAVIATGRALGALFTRLGQPPVIGEVVAGILLGPSLLGREGSALLLPPAAAPYLGVIAQLGVILYMFLIGLELNAGWLRHHVQASVA